MIMSGWVEEVFNSLKASKEETKQGNCMLWGQRIDTLQVRVERNLQQTQLVHLISSKYRLHVLFDKP